MKYLTIKSTSSSFSFNLYEEKDLVCNGVLKNIGFDDSFIEINYNKKIEEENVIINHDNSSKVLFDKLISLGIISSHLDIRAIGFMVFGHCDYDSLAINDSVISDILNMDEDTYSIIMSFKKYSNLMIAVFDSGFFKSISDVNYLYSVPYKWYTDYGVRKYGYGGLKIRSIMNYLNKKKLNKDKIVFCDLEDNTIISAVNKGECIASSYGFNSSSGDVDPSIILFIMEKEGKNASEVVSELKNNGGMFGVSGYNDIETIMEKCEVLDERSILAKNKYVMDVVSYISQYYVLMGGIDSIVFTGKYSLDYSSIRREICEKLGILGVKIDLDLNSEISNFDIQVISSKDSSILVLTSPYDENEIILNDMMKYVDR